MHVGWRPGGENHVVGEPSWLAVDGDSDSHGGGRLRRPGGVAGRARHAAAGRRARPGLVRVGADGLGEGGLVPQGRHFGRAGAYVDFVSTTDGFAWVSSSGITSGQAPDMYVTTNSGRTWIAITPRQA